MKQPTEQDIIKAYNIARETGADSTCKVLEALYPDVDFTPKDNRPVEEYFRYYGWTDEEVMAFPILPSSNFDEGFEAGKCFVQWRDTNESQPDDYENVLVCIETGWSSEFAIAYYDGKNWYTSDGMKIKPLCWMEIPEYNINGFGNRKYNNPNIIKQ